MQSRAINTDRGYGSFEAFTSLFILNTFNLKLAVFSNLSHWLQKSSSYFDSAPRVCAQPLQDAIFYLENKPFSSPGWEKVFCFVSS